LRPVKHEEGRFTGTYECSECGLAFKPKETLHKFCVPSLIGLI
jgi:hypothetical protein